jgi:hypothetical protein
MEAVGALAADLDRRCGRDRQLHLAAEVREPMLELVPAGRVLLRNDLALAVARRGAYRQVDVREVPLVETDEPWCQSSCRAGQHQ